MYEEVSHREPAGRYRPTPTTGGSASGRTSSYEVARVRTEVSGSGYHHHNWGNVGMMSIIHDWYWARGQAGPYSVIASYITAQSRSWAWSIDRMVAGQSEPVIEKPRPRVTRQGNAMARYVLVHGSWHDGTSWADVTSHLEELGHDVHSPTMAGHGPGVPRAVSHDDCVNSVVDYVHEQGLTDFVLVGHSFGGSEIARTAERLPDRIRRLVFWNAFVPASGTSV
jgi:pimeloyl-ACP methyl ester carboxylesterase